MKSLSLLIIALLVTACGGKPSEPEAAAVMAPEATQEVIEVVVEDTSPRPAMVESSGIVKLRGSVMRPYGRLLSIGPMSRLKLDGICA